MNNKNILYVCQEVAPYVCDNSISSTTRYLAQYMQEHNMSVRTFMPCFGSINERRNQLHEVKRFYGMNLIINGSDYQLIIKVASIPVARVQIYFIDNEDFFKRKYVLTNENGVYFADNDERAMFFARGVLETVKKLRWAPDIVHCHGWISSVVPIYIRQVFNEDPLFAKTKIVISLYDDSFEGALDPKFKAKLQSDGVTNKDMDMLDKPDYDNLMKFALSYADGVIYCSENISKDVKAYIKKLKIPVLDFIDAENAGSEYIKFYDKISGE